MLEYKTVPKADSGVYLRGTPQVQIWDWNQVYDPKKPTRRPHLGSGGLFNNKQLTDWLGGSSTPTPSGTTSIAPTTNPVVANAFSYGANPSLYYTY